MDVDLPNDVATVTYQRMLSETLNIFAKGRQCRLGSVRALGGTVPPVASQSGHGVAAAAILRGRDGCSSSAGVIELSAVV